MRSHEYVLIDGVSRAHIGRYLGTAAALVSAACVFLALQVIGLAERYGLDAHLTPSVMSLIGAAAVYGVLYWLFNRFLWRMPPIAQALRIPDLTGAWQCIGTTLNERGDTVRTWSGDIAIAQSWDRLRIRLSTDDSGSSSRVAALMHDDAGGYRLFYTYENDPRNDRPELRHHMGFADMVISIDQQRASGEYFNGRGRVTFGRMEWRKQR